MAETMIERVARAMCKSAGGDPDFLLGGAGVNAPAWRLYETFARAAIEAMREPTEAMLVAAVDGAGRMPPLSEDMDFTEVWIAMIDAALKESPNA